MGILQTEVWRGGTAPELEKIKDTSDETITSEVILTEGEEATFFLLKMAWDQ